MTGDAWRPRPLYLPDTHLPNTAQTEWTCRQCTTPWPCPTAQPYLQPGQCECGSATYWESNGRRRWHIGPQCYTQADAMNALAKELHQKREANPHYPPSHYYPPKPRRRQRQRPPYRHTPTRPGDIRPGTLLWVRPGGLHPGWGDITQLAMLTRLDTPKCEVWVWIDSTVHQVRPEHLILEGSAARRATREAGTEIHQQGNRRRPLLPEWEWLNWTMAQHIAHQEQQHPQPHPAVEAVQEQLFNAS